jgi:hypothetical protein
VVYYYPGAVGHITIGGNNLLPVGTASGLPQTGRSPSNAEPTAAAQI